MRRGLMGGILLSLTVAVLPLLSASQSSATSLPKLSVASGADIVGSTDTQLAFSAHLSTPATTTVTVAYQTVNGSATAGTNYVMAEGTLSIPAGSSGASIGVTILPQPYTSTSSNLTFDLSLSGATGASLVQTTAVGTIHSDPDLANINGTLEDAVIDPTSHYAYITNYSDNEVDVLDLNTGNFERPIAVGSEPTGLDITKSGTRLYVCDSGSPAISVVNLTTRKTIKTIVTPPGIMTDTAYGIALTDNDKAVFTQTFKGSGFQANVYVLNLKTDAFTVLSTAGAHGLVTEETRVFRSADYSTIAGVLGDESGGPFFVYHAATGSVKDGGVNSNLQWGALNSTGTKLLVDPGTHVINASTGALLGAISTTSNSGVAIAPSGNTAYSVGNGAVNVLDLSTFLQTATIPAPDATGAGTLVVSPDGHTLVALTTSGVTIIKT